MITPPQSTAHNLNPDPKDRFQSIDGNVSKHKKLLEDHSFERAIDFAILQYNRELANRNTDQYQAIKMAAKLEAIQEFVLILRTLAEKPMSFTVPRVVDHLPEIEKVN